VKEEKKVIIPVTGGLGNQLFQFSAALSQANKRNIICEILKSLNFNSQAMIFRNH
jgi:hypothetical protein